MTTIGSLFTGYGGLDMGVAMATGTRSGLWESMAAAVETITPPRRVGHRRRHDRRHAGQAARLKPLGDRLPHLVHAPLQPITEEDLT